MTGFDPSCCNSAHRSLRRPLQLQEFLSSFLNKNPEMIRGLADRTGLEPATSAVTGQHSNQLNYRSFSFQFLREAKITLQPVFSKSFYIQAV